MKRKIGKMVQFTGKVWSWMVFTAAIVLLLFRFAPIPFGYEPIWCMSNSMAPTFHEGALCYIDTNYEVDSIEIGDIIAYQLSDGSLVTHRVYDITEEGIVTKGDANNNVDFAPINKSQIIGENAIQIEYLGNLFKEFPNKFLISIVVFAIAVMLSLDIVSDILLNEEKKDDKEVEVNNSNNNIDIN